MDIRTLQGPPRNFRTFQYSLWIIHAKYLVWQTIHSLKWFLYRTGEYVFRIILSLLIKYFYWLHFLFTTFPHSLSSQHENIRENEIKYLYCFITIITLFFYFYYLCYTFNSGTEYVTEMPLCQNKFHDNNGLFHPNW